MSKRDERPSAADLLAKHPPYFATAAPFAKVFPELADFRIEVKRQRRGWGPPQALVFTPDNPPGEYIDCTNSLCYGGGFAIATLLREMVQSRQAEHDGFLFCRGYEGSPKGRVRYRDCGEEATIKVRLSYK